ncbi:MAG: large conductance mechanosensitive channel protein MscL [Phycisphaerales bacterium]
MGMIQEFKKFALRGNLADMAIGFTVGAAFTTVAKSLVNDIIMPPVGLLVGRVDFEDLFWVLRAGEEDLGRPYYTIEEAQAAGAVTLNYGVFANNCLALFVVAIAMFLIIRSINRLDDELDDAFVAKQAQTKSGEPPTHRKCPFCLTTVPFRATRCSACTSEMPSPGDASAATA